MGIINYVKKALVPMYKLVRYSDNRRVYTYTNYYNKLVIKSGTIFYESRDGQNMSDSPLAIFDYLLEKDPRKIYQHI